MNVRTLAPGRLAPADLKKDAEREACEFERRDDADVRGIVSQAWWPKPIAH